MKVVIVGGGPSGLYLGLLLKKRSPQWQVSILEQNPADATFGFGVVLADSGLQYLRQADEASYQLMHNAMHYNQSQIIVHRETPIRYELPVKGGAITRLTLLQILEQQAEQAGVDIRYGIRLETADDLSLHGLEDADVVVGADGANSVIRKQFSAHFQTEDYPLSNHFAWYGTDRVFEEPALVFRQHQGGCFVAHYYAYSKNMSTFVAECDHRTWTQLQLEHYSDDERQALFENIYAKELNGHSLISNMSSWRQFQVVRNRQWHHDRYVLIGDALTSAHFSIGSGTRIAMADAVALADALHDNASNPKAALQQFQQQHQQQKNKLISASEKSYLWYEQLTRWMNEFSAEEFVYAFMTRTGRVDDERLNREFPELMQRLQGGLL